MTAYLSELCCHIAYIQWVEVTLKSTAVNSYGINLYDRHLYLPASVTQTQTNASIHKPIIPT